MKKDTAGPGTESTTPMWESLERMVRERAQEFIQQILEEEVTEVLGREKSERKSAVDPAPGYRNGYGKPRRLSMSSGTVTVRRPRVRGLEERFESRVLPLFARRTKEVGELIPELYLHGLAEGDFELALRGLLGEGAPLSKASIRRLRATWVAEFATRRAEREARAAPVVFEPDPQLQAFGERATQLVILLVVVERAGVRPHPPVGLHHHPARRAHERRARLGRVVARHRDAEAAPVQVTPGFRVPSRTCPRHALRRAVRARDSPG
ncbi:MAG: transposase [Gemmatimonadota bacterium]